MIQSDILSKCHSSMDVVAFLRDDVFVNQLGASLTDPRVTEADKLLGRFQRARQRRDKLHRHAEDTRFVPTCSYYIFFIPLQYFDGKISFHRAPPVHNHNIARNLLAIFVLALLLKLWGQLLSIVFQNSVA